MRSIMITAVAAIALSGCAQTNSNAYAPYEIGATAYTETGVITAERPIEIGSQGGTGIGTFAGALAGGILGSEIGPGRSSRRFGRRNRGSGRVTSALGAIGGAVVGGIIGTVVEREATRRQGVEYVIRLDDGQLVTIAQESGPIGVGRRVFVQIPNRGRARVVPAA